MGKHYVRDLGTLLWCQVNHIIVNVMILAMLLDGLRGAGVLEDCSLSNFSERQNREKQPCGVGRHEFWSFFFFMACLISLLRVPTNTVRLLSASLPVYRWVNASPSPEKKKIHPSWKVQHWLYFLIACYWNTASVTFLLIAANQFPGQYLFFITVSFCQFISQS